MIERFDGDALIGRRRRTSELGRKADAWENMADKEGKQPRRRSLARKVSQNSGFRDKAAQLPSNPIKVTYPAQRSAKAIHGAVK